MNNQLSSYLEKARHHLIKESNVTSISDRELSAAFDLNPSAVNQWRKRNTLPSDEVMLKIAVIGKMDPLTALMDLNSWRSEGISQNVYKSMATVLRKVIARTGENPLVALVNDSIKPTKGEKRQSYQKIFKGLQKTAGMLAIATVLALPQPVEARISARESVNMFGTQLSIYSNIPYPTIIPPPHNR